MWVYGVSMIKTVPRQITQKRFRLRCENTLYKYVGVRLRAVWRMTTPFYTLLKSDTSFNFSFKKDCFTQNQNRLIGVTQPIFLRSALLQTVCATPKKHGWEVWGLQYLPAQRFPLPLLWWATHKRSLLTAT